MKNLITHFNFKKATHSILATLILILFTISCSNSDKGSNLPTAAGFNNIKTSALTSLTQNFQFNTANGSASFTSVKGVMLSISASALTLNGNPVTGLVDLKYIEIFDGGNMVATGKHTMGKMPDGNRSMLLSGGEFYINATQNGQQLELNGSITLGIPTNLTDVNGGNPDMTLWKLVENDSVWAVAETDQLGQNGVFIEGQGGISTYYAFVGNFGWTNVDCFYNDLRPKTTILVSVPDGYDNLNSAVYLHYDGNGNALAKLDTYDNVTELFSEHYGQIPIGLNCHIIFATEENGNPRYAIKQVTISADAVYNFTLSETTVVTQAQLTAAINALP